MALCSYMRAAHYPLVLFLWLLSRWMVEIHDVQVPKNKQQVIVDVAIFNISVLFQIDLMPHDVITQLLRVLAIDTKQEKAIINAEPTEVSLSGLEAFSFDYIVKWPLSLIINR